MNAHVSKTKVAEGLFLRPSGATMGEVIGATGGPQYSTLRKLEGLGYAIRKMKEGNETRYRAIPPAAPSYEATITSKGQVTIPREVREQLRLRSGFKLRFAVENSDRAVITPVARKLSDLAGMLGKPRRSATLEDMDEAIGGAVVERYLRAVGKKR